MIWDAWLTKCLCGGVWVGGLVVWFMFKVWLLFTIVVFWWLICGWFVFGLLALYSVLG